MRRAPGGEAPRRSVGRQPAAEQTAGARRTEAKRSPQQPDPPEGGHGRRSWETGAFALGRGTPSGSPSITDAESTQGGRDFPL
jgi:hypothetical protein